MNWLLCSAILGGLGVATGAFGAHGLKTMFAELEPTEAARQIDIFKTAARYSLVHGAVLLGVYILSSLQPSNKLQLAGWAFFIGTMIFSGTLWVLVLSGQKWLGAITPIGGAMIIVGWLSLGVEAVTHKRIPAPEAVNE